MFLTRVFIYTASSKQRAKLRKAIASDHKKLEKLAKQYNDLIDCNSLQLPCTTTEDISSGHFPWSSLSSRHSVSVQQKYQISNLYNQIQRLKEEEKLLLQEMAQYIHYFKETLPKKLQGDIADIAEGLQSVTLDVVTGLDQLNDTSHLTNTVSWLC